MFRWPQGVTGSHLTQGGRGVQSTLWAATSGPQTGQEALTPPLPLSTCSPQFPGQTWSPLGTRNLQRGHDHVQSRLHKLHYVLRTSKGERTCDFSGISSGGQVRGGITWGRAGLMVRAPVKSTDAPKAPDEASPAEVLPALTRRDRKSTEAGRWLGLRDARLPWEAAADRAEPAVTW